ncbi:MAG TPA: ATP-binding protein [Solirubrobacteraceae bacterium]|nr:ATP-binding protein [Solirubrobacteraceae bacterium]
MSPGERRPAGKRRPAGGAARDGPADDVRLDEVVQGMVASARRRGEVGFELSLELTMVLGRADRIGRALSNLIDNARKWSPAGGVVEVALKGGVLSVRDRGPGFQEADLSGQRTPPFGTNRLRLQNTTHPKAGSGELRKEIRLERLIRLRGSRNFVVPGESMRVER